MNNLALIVIPLLGAVLAALWKGEGSRPWLLPAVALPHSVLSLVLLAVPPPVRPGAWLAFDALTRAILPVVSLLFLACAWYGVSYLRVRCERPNRVFVGAMLVLLGMLSLALQARHLGLLWIATETMTLVCVPLIHFNNTPRAYEATWKYLLVGSTGIALSLLGSFCLGYASLLGGGSGDLTFVALTAQGTHLNRPWVIMAWVLLLAGYGTKLGLAPMHTWKPDAYGEAPAMAGAMMAGGVTTVSFAAILRIQAVVQAAGLGEMTSRTLLALGLFSMLVAALFLLGTRDFKRMLAYSSVEHMGILAVGAALGPLGIGAALFHVWSNSLVKGAMFLSAGNIRRAAGARTVDEVTGMSSVTPLSAGILITGMLAVTACPPFGPFFSELRVVAAALGQGRYASLAFFVGCLMLAFLGMSRLVLAIADGWPRRTVREGGRRFPETPGLCLPQVLLLGASLWLGLAMPSCLPEAWAAAVAALSPVP